MNEMQHSRRTMSEGRRMTLVPSSAAYATPAWPRLGTYCTRPVPSTTSASQPCSTSVVK